MGKDRSGKFHPGKGRPSGANKAILTGIRPKERILPKK
jgi:hypothetical protein